MSRIVVLDNEWVTLWYYPDKKIVHHQVHKYAYGKILREYLSFGVEILKKNGATKWLSDERNNAALSKEDQEWGKVVWESAAYKAGWRFWAIVLPASIVGKMNLKTLINRAESAELVVQTFTDSDEAMAWLEQQ